MAKQDAKIMIFGEWVDFDIVLVKKTRGHGHQL